MVEYEIHFRKKYKRDEACGIVKTTSNNTRKRGVSKVSSIASRFNVQPISKKTNKKFRYHTYIFFLFIGT